MRAIESGLKRIQKPGEDVANFRLVAEFAGTEAMFSYRVYRGTTATSLTILATDILTTSYRDTPPLSGTYYYQVTAVGATGAESPRSIMIQVKF